MRSDDDIFNVRSVGEIALWMLFSPERLVQMTSNFNMTSRRLVKFSAIWIIIFWETTKYFTQTQ